MGEIFERTTPASALAWTGERLTTEVSGQVEIEHLHRYFFARAFCRKLDVLDIACGEGYGSALLAQVARSVVGIDVSAEVVSHAQTAYASPHLRFQQGDARCIELADASIDVVVSFETIEHFFEHEAFVAEVRRVLRPGGLFIVSSPERDVYSPADQSPNPYHVRELTHSEFGGLLAGSFRHVTMYAQRPLLGSAIMAEVRQADAGPLVTFERRGDRHFECSEGLPRPLYLVAIASDVPHSDSNGSLYLETGNLEAVFAQIRKLGLLTQQAEIWRQQVIDGQAEIEALKGEQTRIIAEYSRKERIHQVALSEKDQQLSELSSELRDLASEVGQLTSKVSESEQLAIEAEAVADQLRKDNLHQAMLNRNNQDFIHQLTSRLTESEQRVEQLLRSTSWKVTGPMRGFVTRHPAAVSRLRGLVARHPALRRLTVRTLRRVWRLTRRNAVPMVIAPPPRVDSVAINVEYPPLIAPAANSNQLATPPQLWFYLGDTLEWLQAHRQLSGVGRVTAELFFASLGEMDGCRMLPCALAPNEAGLSAISLRETVTFMASRVGTHTPSELMPASDSAAAPPASAFLPSPGSHVLFTGVVWTPSYEALFQTLAQHGVRFSVLVYDIIPIEHPEFVTEPHSRMFTQWLGTTLTLASVVFVTGQSNKDQILRWAALSSIVVAADIALIDFGATEHQRPLSAEGLATSGATARVRLNSFVLCVGTIDRRKNQAMLCRLWQRLIADLGRHKVPQLVLVGRNDLPALSMGMEPLFEALDIVVLEEVGDAELAGLYRCCLMTAFPSLAEGYGLPVAESLGSGKLCIASDLPVIREHAGDLPWYFKPGDEEAAYALLRRAILDPAARVRAEAQIAEHYQPTTWKSTYLSMASIVGQFDAPSARHRPEPEVRPVIPGIVIRPIPAVLATAQAWCTDLNPEVSILVINWNASQLTRECIRQIWANTTGIRYEIIIADNGSSAADLEALRSLGSGVRLLALGTNRYFGEANNIAAEQAKGRYILLLNNDAFVQPDSLRHLVNCLDNDPDAGAAGPLFLFPDGTIQEAGAGMDKDGFPARFGRGQSADTQAFLSSKFVDYISAAALLVRRDLFLAVGGFDPTYEPAYYEDVDLCFKLRSVGRKTCYCPEARVVHIEGSAANHNPVAEARRRTLGDLNRGKFVSRWGAYLRSRDDADLPAIAKQVLSPTAHQLSKRLPGTRRAAAVFTPYPLTPGGGERFLLTTASALARDYDVTIVTSYPYSHLRLLTIGLEFDIDLSECRLQTAAEFEDAPDPDLLAVMGNHIVPPIPARSKDSVFICQFPFPLAEAEVRDIQASMGNYRAVVVYSEYVRAHVLAGLSAYRLPPWPVEVVYPPAPQHAGAADRKKNMILSVGRFFAGGHNKRHDLMMVAFKSLLERVSPDLELHLAGSSMPDPMHMDYLESLQQMASGLPITFHVNAPRETLSELYRDAAVYWHATGVESDLARHPELAEHFGISIVEAMSAECIPVAYGAGGPREIITHGNDGFLYYSIAELVDISADLLRAESAPLRRSIGKAAARRAAAFAPEVFMARMRDVLHVQHALEEVDGD